MGGELSSAWWGLILLGLCAGVLSGLLGVGSGILLIPALVLMFALEQKSAQGTALAVMVPMALLGAYRYWQNPNIEVPFIFIGLITIGALVGVFFGTMAVDHVPADRLRKIFAVFLIVVAVRMLTMPTKPKQPADPSAPTSGHAAAPPLESRN